MSLRDEERSCKQGRCAVNLILGTGYGCSVCRLKGAGTRRTRLAPTMARRARPVIGSRYRIADTLSNAAASSEVFARALAGTRRRSPSSSGASGPAVIARVSSILEHRPIDPHSSPCFRRDGRPEQLLRSTGSRARARPEAVLRH